MSRNTRSADRIRAATEHSDVLTHLRRGDSIEATGLDGIYYRGIVNEVAPQLGVVWIDEGPLGLRTMLDSREHVIRVIG
jgi:hypothetical protein